MKEGEKERIRAVGEKLICGKEGKFYIVRRRSEICIGKETIVKRRKRE